jgi:hypothetical protein
VCCLKSRSSRTTHLSSCDDEAWGLWGDPIASLVLAREESSPVPGCEPLGALTRVTVLSVPAGSGKTVLLRSWMGQASLAGCVAWVSVVRDAPDAQQFWLSVLGALRQTSAGSGLAGEVSAAPDLDGWATVERLLKDLGSAAGASLAGGR